MVLWKKDFFKWNIFSILSHVSLQLKLIYDIHMEINLFNNSIIIYERVILYNHLFPFLGGGKSSEEKNMIKSFSFFPFFLGLCIPQQGIQSNFWYILIVKKKHQLWKRTFWRNNEEWSNEVDMWEETVLLLEVLTHSLLNKL